MSVTVMARAGCSTPRPTRKSAKTSKSASIRSHFNWRRKAPRSSSISRRSARSPLSTGIHEKSRNGSSRALGQISLWRSMKRTVACSWPPASLHVCWCWIWRRAGRLQAFRAQSTRTTCLMIPIASASTSPAERASFSFTSKLILTVTSALQKSRRQSALAPAHIRGRWENTTASIWRFPLAPIEAPNYGCTKRGIEHVGGFFRTVTPSARKTAVTASRRGNGRGRSAIYASVRLVHADLSIFRALLEHPHEQLPPIRHKKASSAAGRSRDTRNPVIVIGIVLLENLDGTQAVEHVYAASAQIIEKVVRVPIHN